MPSHTRPARMGNTQYDSRNMVSMLRFAIVFVRVVVILLCGRIGDKRKVGKGPQGRRSLVLGSKLKRRQVGRVLGKALKW